MENTKTAQEQKISGYTYGTDAVARSPITMDEWETLKKSALFSEEDVFYLRLSHDVLADQVADLLKTWRGIIFDYPHLRAYDEDPKTGKVDTEYAQAVGKALRPVGARHGQSPVRSGVARLSIRNRTAPSSHEKKSDGQRPYSRIYSRA